MTPTYREAKARVGTMPPAEQDAYLRRLIDYRQDLERAGLPWAALGYIAFFAGIFLIGSAKGMPGSELAVTILGAVLAVSSFAAHRAAAKKKREYERAHPFQG